MNCDKYRSAMDKLEAEEEWKEKLADAMKRRAGQQPQRAWRMQLAAGCACVFVLLVAVVLWRNPVALMTAENTATAQDAGEAATAGQPVASAAATADVFAAEGAPEEAGSGAETEETEGQSEKQDTRMQERIGESAEEPQQTADAGTVESSGQASSQALENSSVTEGNGQSGSAPNVFTVRAEDRELVSETGRVYRRDHRNLELDTEEKQELYRSKYVGEVGTGEEFAGNYPEGSKVYEISGYKAGSGYIVVSPDGESEAVELVEVPEAENYTFEQAAGCYTEEEDSVYTVCLYEEDGGVSVVNDLDLLAQLDSISEAAPLEDAQAGNGVQAALYFSDGGRAAAAFDLDDGTVELLGNTYRLPEGFPQKMEKAKKETKSFSEVTGSPSGVTMMRITASDGSSVEIKDPAAAQKAVDSLLKSPEWLGKYYVLGKTGFCGNSEFTELGKIEITHSGGKLELTFTQIDSSMVSVFVKGDGAEEGAYSPYHGRITAREWTDFLTYAEGLSQR